MGSDTVATEDVKLPETTEVAAEEAKAKTTEVVEEVETGVTEVIDEKESAAVPNITVVSGQSETLDSPTTKQSAAEKPPSTTEAESSQTENPPSTTEAESSQTEKPPSTTEA